jgi:transposase
MIAAKGIGRVDELIELAEKDATLPNAARGAAKVLAGQIEGLGKSLDTIEEEIAAAQAGSDMSRLLVEVPGIGKLIATAIAATMPDPGVVKRGRDFAAWLDAAPKLKRRQAGARSHHQAGQPIYKEAARAFSNFAPQQRGQAQGSVA